ncbi:MAG: hypothetical protein ABFR33_01310 [Verrucomicrobiota bacterium]
MYTTIEADIINGQVKGPELQKLPAQAHVLITLLSSPGKARPAFGTCTSKGIKMDADVFEPLSDKELGDWGLA